MSENRKLDAPIMGVREWVVGGDGSLRSVGVEAQWEPRKAQHARCLSSSDVALLMEHYRFMRMTMHYGDARVEDRLAELRNEIKVAQYGGHPAPQQGCRCGLYAFYDRGSCEEHGDGLAKESGVRGVVSAWGNVIRAEYGFRAEYMRLEATISEQKSLKRDFWTAHATAGPAYKALADKHVVPLIKPEEVSVFVQLSGGTVLDPEKVPEPEPSYAELDAVM